jgi:hypothetical protein
VRLRAWEEGFDNWLLGLPEEAGPEVVKLRKHLLAHHDEFLAHLPDLEPKAVWPVPLAASG